jgi:MPBQ/MSBQ methyltransferase
LTSELLFDHIDVHSALQPSKSTRGIAAKHNRCKVSPAERCGLGGDGSTCEDDCSIKPAPMNTESPESQCLNEQVTELYDEMFGSDIHEEMFEASGYSNWGYWYPDTLTPARASQQLLDKLLRPVPQTGAVLDVACGCGGTTAHLTRCFDRVTAINVSAVQIARTRGRAPGCQALQMDATQLSFPDRSFEAVVCVEAAFHFSSKARFLSQAWRVLKPGGWLVMSDAVFCAPRSSYSLRLLPTLPPSVLPHANEWNLLAYRDFLEVLGFKPDIGSAYQESWKRFQAYERAYCQRKILSDPARAQVYREILARNAVIDHELCDYLLVAAQKL